MMDIILDLADDFFLDAVWAAVWPASTHAPWSPSFTPSVGGRGAAVNVTAHALSGVAHSALLTPEHGAKALSALGRDNIFRQFVSLYALTYVGILLLYFFFAGASYLFVFNHNMMRHPRFLKNQVRLEINHSLQAFPWLDLLTVPWFVGEVRGYSRLYANVDDFGWAYLLFSIPFFLVFTDTLIYFIHRYEHHPLIYKHIHKPHHRWLVPTPFASHAFHPLDGYAQSLPYHIFVFVFPLHKYVYIGLFTFVNVWSILIHDSDMICGTPFEKIINGPAHHTLHHLYFNYNYGQYFTTCDRLGGSYRHPKAEYDPLHDVQKLDNVVHSPDGAEKEKVKTE